IANTEQFYQFLSAEYHISVGIVILLALIKLSRNTLGIGGSILKNSDYYRLLLIAAFVTVGLAFILNYLMIPAWGLYGAAIASMTAFFVYDFLKVWFVYKKFKVQPFTKKTLYLTLFIAVFTSIFFYLDFSENAFWGIAIKSTLITLIYLPVIYKANFSEDISALIDKVLLRK